MSSIKPNIPKTASGTMSKGDMKYNRASKNSTTTLNLNIITSPPTEKNSVHRWRNNIGRSLSLSTH